MSVSLWRYCEIKFVSSLPRNPKVAILWAAAFWMDGWSYSAPWWQRRHINCMGQLGRTEDIRYKNFYLKRTIQHTDIYIYIYTYIHTHIYVCVYIYIYSNIYTRTSRRTHWAPSGVLHLHLPVQMFSQIVTLLARDTFVKDFFFFCKRMREECEFISFLVPVTQITAALSWLEVLGAENTEVHAASSDHSR